MERRLSQEERAQDLGEERGMPCDMEERGMPCDMEKRGMPCDMEKRGMPCDKEEACEVWHLETDGWVRMSCVICI